MKNVKMWKCGIMKLWKYGNGRVPRLVSRALTAFGVCIFAYFHTSTIAYCGEAVGFSVCAVGDSITEGGAKFVAHRVALENEFAVFHPALGQLHEGVQGFQSNVPMTIKKEK